MATEVGCPARRGRRSGHRGVCRRANSGLVQPSTQFQKRRGTKRTERTPNGPSLRGATRLPPGYRSHLAAGLRRAQEDAPTSHQTQGPDLHATVPKPVGAHDAQRSRRKNRNTGAAARAPCGASGAHGVRGAQATVPEASGPLCPLKLQGMGRSGGLHGGCPERQEQHSLGSPMNHTGSVWPCTGAQATHGRNRQLRENLRGPRHRQEPWAPGSRVNPRSPGETERNRRTHNQQRSLGTSHPCGSQQQSS